MKKFELCQMLCGLENADNGCFRFQIKECHGACLNQESNESYNERALEAVEAIQRILDQDMIIIDDGRSSDEASVILVEDGSLKGFGYIPKNDVQYGIEELKEAILPMPINREADRIIKTYLVKHPLKTIPI